MNTSLPLIKIGIVDDHILFREVLGELLGQGEGDFRVVLEADNGMHLCSLLEGGSVQVPDVILLDWLMPYMGGMATLVWLKNNFPDILTVILSMSKEETLMTLAISEGAATWFHKDVSIQQLAHGIKEVARLHYYFHEGISPALINFIRSQKRNHVVVRGPFGIAPIRLTKFEADLVRYIGQEMSSEEIGRRMSTTTKAVDYHCGLLYQKFNVNGRVGLAIEACKRGLLE